jgi:tRNA splicing ligase
MMARAILLTVAALAVGFPRPLSPPNAARPTPAFALPQEMNFTLQGKITQHAAGKLTVNTEGNIIFRVTYNDKTEITRADGSAGSSQDLQVGKTIHVDGDLQESGEIIAHKIEVLAEPDSKK